MILYHGSNLIVDKPDVLHSERLLDFGRAFYLTSVKEQAERWSRRRAILSNTKCGYVSSYEFSEKSDFIILDLTDNLEEWIDFVCACRDGSDIYKKYDVIRGYVADDKVFRVVDMYKRGVWNRDRAIQEIRIYPMYNQTAFVTQKAEVKLTLITLSH